MSALSGSLLARSAPHPAKAASQPPQSKEAYSDYRHAIEVLRPDVALRSGERIHERFGLVDLPAVSTRVSLAHGLTELGQRLRLKKKPQH